MKKILVLLTLALGLISAPALADCACLHEPCEIQQCSSGSPEETWMGYFGESGDGVNFGEWLILEDNPGPNNDVKIKIELGDEIGDFQHFQITDWENIDLEAFNSFEIKTELWEWDSDEGEWVKLQVVSNWDSKIQLVPEDYQLVPGEPMDPVACMAAKEDFCYLNPYTQTCNAQACVNTKWCSTPAGGYCYIQNSTCAWEDTTSSCECYTPGIDCWNHSILIPDFFDWLTCKYLASGGSDPRACTIAIAERGSTWY